MVPLKVTPGLQGNTPYRKKVEPMTNEELVALIQAGDHVQDNMGQLYQQNRKFIAKLVYPFRKLQ